MRTPINETMQWLGMTAAATLLTLGAACGACDPPSSGDPNPPATEAPAKRQVLDLYVFGRVLGTIAPCGCTTEPLGGVNYAFGYIESSSTPESRVVIEPGSFLYPAPEGPEAPSDEAAWNQADERATLLQTRFAALGERLVSGLGPTDLSSPKGAEVLKRWSLPRTLANLDASARDPLGVAGHRLVPAAGGTIGVTTVIDPAAPGAESLKGLAPLKQSLTEEIAAMRSAGADLVVVQFHAARPAIEALLGEVPGIDVAVVGLVETGERTRVGSPPAKVGETWLLEPGEQGQTLSHLRLTIDNKPGKSGLPSPKSWTVTPTKAALEEELARVEERLAKFKDAPDADPSFLRNLEGERDRLKADLAGEGAASGPATAVFDQVKVTCKLPSDDKAAAALTAYDAWVSEQNRARFAGITPPEPAEGDPRYVGMEECEACHDEAYEFWTKTRHAGAYATLVEDNKQFDLSCVGCHVTGFRKPGGSEVVENHDLQSVQCEQCHGPGSIHIEEPELDGKANAITKDPSVEVCLECHTPEHSDTFDHKSYLRDILGPGHGPAERLALGDGPTGAELRAAGFAKAGGSCKKMKMKK